MVTFCNTTLYMCSPQPSVKSAICWNFENNWIYRNVEKVTGKRYSIINWSCRLLNVDRAIDLFGQWGTEEVIYLSNCLIRCVCKKLFLSFPYFSPWLLKKIFAPPPPTSSTEFPPLYMCCNFHHFGITKRKVMASKLQVTASKLQVTPTKLQVTCSNLTSLTADTDKFHVTNMLFITF